MKKSVLLVAAASALVLTAAACGSSVGSSQAICVDRKTNQRIDDSWCNSQGDHDPGMGWFYLSNGQTAPAVGARTSQGSWDVPKNTKPTYGGINKSGGSVNLNKTATAPAPKANSGTRNSTAGGSRSSGSSSRGGSVSSGGRGK